LDEAHLDLFKHIHCYWAFWWAWTWKCTLLNARLVGVTSMYDANSQVQVIK